ncbi:hypothetical protein GQ43DRAFT_454252 [Delitschia confertaspora ATCC 74209]|uniref:Ras modification protein ERF4 n=1 Tax=Delitschia confertaspora ATCC 74209 TaxID=1513339 RepID=A0A9P4JQU8_9PLEO|nr:hypothetical protein GQ43DRAFT_454252 [Delitschia confertaspora ATCC 74209]
MNPENFYECTPRNVTLGLVRSTHPQLNITASALHSHAYLLSSLTTASQAVSHSSALPSRPTASSQSPPPLARWSLTNRIFRIYNAVPRPPPASRLWNPVNSSPRHFALPNVPLQHPQLAEGLPKSSDGRDEYPLLSLPEQRRSRQSPAPSSLLVEGGSAGVESGRTSIGLPRDRRSFLIHSQPLTPRLPMPMEQLAAPAARWDDAVIPPPHPEDPEAGTAKPRGAVGHGDDRDVDADSNASEYSWGPSHPCFPHPNPHVPLSSSLYDTTRIIRIKRDWMVAGDLAPTFANVYPEILDPFISEDAFRDIIKTINNELIAAFNPMSLAAWLDAVMGVATFWLWEDVGLTAVKRKLHALEKWIENWNRKVGQKEGVRIIPLRRTGYLTLDIQIPDPHVGVDNGTSRPNTQHDLNAAAAPQRHGDLAPYPVAPTLQVS